jgi:hypothetical protein
MKETMTAYSKAMSHGETSKSKAWIDHLKEKSKTLVVEYVSLILHEHHSSQVKKLMSLSSVVPEHLKLHIHFLICQCYYHASVKLLEEDCKLSVHLIKECYFYYEECKRLINIEKKAYDNRDSFIYLLETQKLDELIESVLFQECIAEGQKQKHIADQFYDKAINENEEIDIELLWDTIDLYKSAILLTKEKVIEIEAECLSKIGIVYFLGMVNEVF